MLNRKVGAIALAVVVVSVSALLAAPVFASAEKPDQIRKEYGGKDNTPDHLMFAFLLRITAVRYEADKEFAIIVVQENMKLGSNESAEEFLDRMLAAGKDLARTKRIVDTAILCQENSVRSKSEIYKSMDSLDDVRITISRYTYSEFKETLSEDEERNFKAWLDDAKEGYSFTALDHSSLYEKRGVDVRVHVDQMCVRYAQEDQARTQQ